MCYHVTGQWIETYSEVEYKCTPIRYYWHIDVNTSMVIFSITFDWEFTDASVNINYSDSIVYQPATYKCSPYHGAREPRYISLISVLEKTI